MIRNAFEFGQIAPELHVDLFFGKHPGAGPCTLVVFIDDATSTLIELRFVTSESTFSYFEALEIYLHKHRRPVAFYSDKHTVFRVAKEDAKGGARRK